MLTKIRKILLSVFLVTMLLNAETDTTTNTAPTESIEDIIKNSIPTETKAEKKAREKAEKEKAKAEAKAKKEREKLAKNATSNEEIEAIINRELTDINNRENSTITNNTQVEKNSSIKSESQHSQSENENIQVNKNTQQTAANQILANRQQKQSKKVVIDKSKPVVIAEDREKITPTEYKDKVIKFIATKDGRVIKSEQERKKHPIASLTKVMNVVVALEQIDKGNASLDDNVCFTPEIANIGGSWLNVKSGDCFKLRDLLRSELIYSANNSAYLVAYHIGKGNIDNFVKLMNEKAKELGMKDTVYNTPAGLPTSMTGKGMDISTAYDMYLLGKKAIEDERIREWASEPELVLLNTKGEQVVYPSRNHLLGLHGIYGLKTGFHNLAGFNIIVTSKIGNLDIISVSLGNISNKARTADQDAEFTQIEQKLKTIYTVGQSIGEISVKNAKKKKIEGILSDNVYELNIDNTKYEYKVKSLKVKAGKNGIKKGDVIGELEVISNGDIISKVDILSTEDISQLSLFGRFIRFITFGLV